MAVTVEIPGKRVKVSPIGGSSIADVLEYAELAIQVHGFRQGEHGVSEPELFENPGKYGLSLHDAVGYAFVRLGEGAQPGKSVGSKDSTLYVDEEAYFNRGEVYDAIHEAIEQEMPNAGPDWETAKADAIQAGTSSPGVTVFENWFNNETDEAAVLNVLRAAREAVPSE